MIETILSIQPRVSISTEEKSPDDVVIDLASIFQSQIPEVLLREQCNPKHFQLTETNSIPSLSTVLFQEMEKFNRMIDLLDCSLRLLVKAIKGFVVMSQDLDEMYVAFLNNQLPPNWKSQSYATLKALGSWFKDFLARVTQIRNWMEKDYIVAHWMSGLYYPQGFLTGVLQTHARRYKVPIDKLSFKFKFQDIEVDKIKEEPKVFPLIFHFSGRAPGLRTLPRRSQVGQPAWNTRGFVVRLALLQSPHRPFPPSRKLLNAGRILSVFLRFFNVDRCPCYKTSNRVGVLSTTGQSTNFILYIDLPSKHEKPEFWTLRGTAILSQLNDWDS